MKAELSYGEAPWQREAQKSLDASQIVFTCVQTAKDWRQAVFKDKFDPETSETKKMESVMV